MFLKRFLSDTECFRIHNSARPLPSPITEPPIIAKATGTDSCLLNDGFENTSLALVMKPMVLVSLTDCDAKIIIADNKFEDDMIIQANQKHERTAEGATITRFRLFNSFICYALRKTLIEIHPSARWNPTGLTVAEGNGKGSGINRLEGVGVRTKTRLQLTPTKFNIEFNGQKDYHI
ncbi:unnamed protein product [Rotaria socialis]|uniref:Uncharacterized protein n=1 Tax=Rotaria socialis TaxID=392032 RepID=A0A820TTL9_9BILA|nr:unnamed protein product [Rotaria socialis]